MISRQQAREKWARRFKMNLGKMAERMGDAEEYIAGVARYLSVEEEVIINSEAGQEVMQTFDESTELSEDEIERLIVRGVPEADNIDEAINELSIKWDLNYAASFGVGKDYISTNRGSNNSK